MTDQARHHEAIFASVAILSSMVQDRSGTQGLRGQILASYHQDSDLTDAEMATALIEVAAVLLIKLEDRGADMQAILQEIASKYP